MLCTLAALFTLTAAYGQSGEDQMKAAGKAYDSYKVSGDAMKLQEAVDALAVAIEDPEVQSDYKNYLEAGDIYAGAITAYVQDRTLAAGEPVEPMVVAAASKAADLYMKAYNMTDKKGGRRAALKGLEELQGNLSNEGIFAIQDGNYKESYEAFNNSVLVHEFLVKEGGESLFTEDMEKLDGERYYAALSAVLNEQYDEAEPLLLALHESEYDDYGVYDGLFKVYSSRNDMDRAGKYLQEGRERYPDETQLLFTEINYYLAEGRLDELTDKLQEAIDAEPNNVSLYATLGNVYDQLYQKQRAEKPEAAQEYFDKAIANYEAGLKIDPDNASLIYSIGALYFNRAASMTEQLVELGNDFSKEGQKKYEAMEAQINEEFDAAYPYFQKAEQTDPSNLNTLIALKEIFARRDNYDASNEMKERIERVQAGEKIEKSYFVENGM
jgi:thioredoxin-like negative regulator of GroEL